MKRSEEENQPRLGRPGRLCPEDPVFQKDTISMDSSSLLTPQRTPTSSWWREAPKLRTTEDPAHGGTKPHCVWSRPCSTTYNGSDQKAERGLELEEPLRWQRRVHLRNHTSPRGAEAQPVRPSVLLAGPCWVPQEVRLL